MIGTHRKDDQRSVRKRHPHGFALAAIDFGPAPESAMKTRGLKPFVTELTSAVRPGKRRDDQITLLHVANRGADRFDAPDELVAHASSCVAVLHRIVRPQIAAADTGSCDGNEGIGRLDQSSIRNILDTNVMDAVHDSCTHGDFLYPLVE